MTEDETEPLDAELLRRIAFGGFNIGAELDAEECREIAATLRAKEERIAALEAERDAALNKVEGLNEVLDTALAASKVIFIRAEAAEAKLSKAAKALERIRNEDQVRYVQIGDDPNENGPTIQIDGPFAKIASATLKEIGGDNE